ncbi:hypothetical protein BVX94_00785 [bacterium B17]|nr:hypothetical protein BVX94_00785 [bacterium B17]
MMFKFKRIKKLLNTRIINKVLSDDKLFEKTVFDPRFTHKISKTKKALDAILNNPGVISRILSDEKIFAQMIANENRLNQILNNPDVLRRLLSDKRSLDQMITNEKCLNQILNNPDALRRLLSDKRSLDRILSDENLVEKILLNDRITNLIVKNSKISNRVFGNKYFLNRLMANSEALNKIFRDPRAKRQRNANLYLDVNEKIEQLSYSPPAFLVSFPRAGSNFIQNVLTETTGILSQSIYAPIDIEPNLILTFKSHSLSMEYLKDEVNRLVSPSISPSKLIILKRDPRDLMISFYEFVKRTKNIELSQESFLEETCYFFASNIDPTSSRKIYVKPMSISQAFKHHISNWFKKEHANSLLVKYENLTDTPETEFQKVFDFLELDCQLNKNIIDSKVSQYSSESHRPRARSYSWKSVQEEYSHIIEHVNRTLKDEINYLEYDV